MTTSLNMVRELYRVLSRQRGTPEGPKRHFITVAPAIQNLKRGGDFWLFSVSFAEQPIFTFTFRA